MKVSMHMMADALADCCEWGQCTDASSRICYLEHNMSLLHTSEALFVHRTTLFNYLKEIRSIVQADLNDPAARMRIIASFQIMDLDAQYRRHVVQ